MDIEEAKMKAEKILSWQNIANSLPLILVIGVVLIIVDKIVGISEKIRPKWQSRKRYRKNVLFEVIDTIGDNIQLISGFIKLLGIDLGEDDLKKIADFLQNLGTGGKTLNALYDLIKPILGGVGNKGKRGNYKELQ